MEGRIHLTYIKENSLANENNCYQKISLVFDWLLSKKFGKQFVQRENTPIFFVKQKKERERERDNAINTVP